MTSPGTGNQSVLCVPQVNFAADRLCINGEFSKKYTCGAALECNPKKYKLIDNYGDTSFSTLILIAADEAKSIDECLLNWNYKLGPNDQEPDEPCEYNAHHSPQPSHIAYVTATNLKTYTTLSKGKYATVTSATKYSMTATPVSSSLPSSAPRSSKSAAIALVLVCAMSIAASLT